jgi:hypothetical protein
VSASDPVCQLILVRVRCREAMLLILLIRVDWNAAFSVTIERQKGNQVTVKEYYVVESESCSIP